MVISGLGKVSYRKVAIKAVIKIQMVQKAYILISIMGEILVLTGISMIGLAQDIELARMERYGQNNEKSVSSAYLRFG
jgi:hypothetical protein